MYKRYSTKRAFIFIITVIALTFIFSTIAGIIYYFGNNPTFDSIVESGMLLTFIMHVSCLIIPSILYIIGIIPMTQIRETLRLNPVSFKNIGYVTAITVLIYPFISLISYISGLFFENVSEEILSETLNMPFYLSMLTIAIMPSISEELVLRGVFLSNFNDSKNFRYALLNGFFFGLLHGNLSQFFFAFFIGVVFYYIVKIGNSLFLSMYAHFLINGSQVLLMYVALDEEALNATETVATYEPAVVTFFTVACVICGLILIPVIRGFIKHNSYNKAVTTNSSEHII